MFYNVTMSAVFGLGVSRRTPELLALNVVGPAFWIGKEGLARVVFAAIGGVALLAYVRWQNGDLRIDDRATEWNSLTTRNALDEK